LAPVSRQQRFESARRLEASDPVAALDQYLAMARGDDSWAANALFAAARLELEQGHAAEARTLLTVYLERFPTGSNADDATALLRRAR
jgi:TolA-binding protein